ncbi:hypothetical protein [Nocardiopsis dassonvillei]|uniref:hypothetical protein n=1 Tax=Nocardiopsis dassonvillei TaxID=2014 RepID=UPI00157C3BBE|nr:hypothetical protein [Nocardiopsis dassonvillei]
MARPDTIHEAAQMAYDAIMRRTEGDHELADIIRRGVEDAHRTGWNRALEGAAQKIEAVDYAEWALAGVRAGVDAAQLVRDHKLTEES